MHAGDQIYYDFPETPQTAADDYRLAYREAWFDDEAAIAICSRIWPHYMTLDDHEIADQFARDFTPPAEGLHARTREEATHRLPRLRAREESRPRRGRRAVREPDSFWYRFDIGARRFFVLDTRTQRCDHGERLQR